MFFVLRICIISLIFGFFCVSCSKNDIEIGSDLSNGKISNKNVVFTFKKYSGNEKMKDLINFIYFEGDTLCFSYVLNSKETLSQKDIKVHVRSKDGKKFPFERVEIKNNRIFGFSLVGSILEEFHKKELHKPYPENKFCCRPIPFSVEIKFRGKSIIKKSSFQIQYK